MTNRPFWLAATLAIALSLDHLEAAENKPLPRKTPPSSTSNSSGFLVRTFSVTDLVSSLPSAPSEQDANWLPSLIMQAVAPDTWRPAGKGWVSLIRSQGCLVVCQTKEVHEQIGDLLEQLRRRQGESIVINVKFLRMPLGVAPPQESPPKTTGGPALRARPVTGADRSSKSPTPEVQGIELPEINLLDGQTVSFTTPSDTQEGVSHWSIQVVVSNDRRNLRVWLGDEMNKNSLATAWLSDGESMTIGLPLEELQTKDKPSASPSSSRGELMQRWLQLTPQLMFLEDGEERADDAQHRVARRPSPRNGSVNVTNAGILSQDY